MQDIKRYPLLRQEAFNDDNQDLNESEVETFIREYRVGATFFICYLKQIYLMFFVFLPIANLTNSVFACCDFQLYVYEIVLQLPLQMPFCLLILLLHDN